VRVAIQQFAIFCGTRNVTATGNIVAADQQNRPLIASVSISSGNRIAASL